MSNVAGLVGWIALGVSTCGVSLAADQTEFELLYSSKLVGEPATLQIGPESVTSCVPSS